MDLDPDVIKRLREDPALFVSKVLPNDDNGDPIEPFEWQKEFLREESERKVVVAGRQVGKTTCIAWLAIHKFTMFPDHDILLVSPTQRQATELFRKLKAEIDEWIDNPSEYGLSEVMKTQIEGANGSRMKAMPAANKGETIRGFTADTVIVDEAAFIEDEVFTSVLSPMLATTDGDFVLAGTPWGEDGYLYNKFHSDNWEEWKVPSMESPLIDSEWIQEQRDDLTSNEFDREILGKFASKGNAAIPQSLWKQCLYRGDARQTRPMDDVDYPRKSTPECYCGVDLATGGKSDAVFTSIDGEGNVFDIKSKEESTLRSIEAQLRTLDQQYNYDGIMMDFTGLGEGIVEKIQEDNRRVEGVRFTLQKKQSLYNNLKREMESEDVTIPNLTPLIREFNAIEIEYTPRGKVKIQPGEGGSDDYFDSLMLAVAAKTDESRVPAATKPYGFGGGDSTIDLDDEEDSERPSKRAYSFGS